MAANHYRALLMELCSISNPEGDLERQAELLEHAIGHAPAFAYLPYNAYHDISAWCNMVKEWADGCEDNKPYQLRDKFFTIIMLHLPQMGQEWLDLAQPQCAEDWGRTKYADWDGQSRMNNREYLQEEGNRCPSCGSGNISGGNFGADCTYAWRPVTCKDCGGEWQEQFVMQSYNWRE